MGQQAKYILQLLFGLSVTATIGTWVLSLIWLPLAIPFLLIVFGTIAFKLRMHYLFLKTITPLRVAFISGVWGGIIAALVYFGSLYVNSPIWFIAFTYLIGVVPAGYLGFRTQEELFTMGISGINDYNALSQTISIIIYAAVLLSLHLLH